MIDLRKLQAFNFENKSVKIGEWILNILCLAYGIYALSPLWIVASILGCVVTYFKVLSRFNKWLDSFVKRRMI